MTKAGNEIAGSVAVCAIGLMLVTEPWWTWPFTVGMGVVLIVLGVAQLVIGLKARQGEKQERQKFANTFTRAFEKRLREQKQQRAASPEWGTRH
jgi:hypothetical protein